MTQNHPVPPLNGAVWNDGFGADFGRSGDDDWASQVDPNQSFVAAAVLAEIYKLSGT